MADVTAWLLVGLGVWLAVSMAVAALLARGGLAHLTRDEHGGPGVGAALGPVERRGSPGSAVEPAAADVPGEPGPPAEPDDAPRLDSTGSPASGDGESNGGTPAERRR